jgi:hypothetical protein
MSDTAVLKEFLIQLGFRVDANSSRTFSDAIVVSTKRVVEFASAVEGAAIAVVAGVERIANGLEDLYFASQRTGAAAENIRALGFAAERLGSSVGGARASLESFRTFLGASPGASSLLASLGIDPSQDTERQMEQFGQYLKTLPEYLQRARAAQFGIDWHTALALMSDDFVGLRRNQEELFTRLGINQKEATEQAHLFENQIGFLGNVFEAMRIKVATLLQQRLSADIQRFREFIEANFDKIALVFESVGKVVLFLADKVLSVFTTIGQDISDLINWWNALDPVTKNTVKTLGELAAAMWALNIAMDANPVVLLGLGILLLLDDYLAWKRGGAHLIDWDKWEPELERAYAGLKTLGEWLDWGVQKIGGWQTVAEMVLAYFAGKWIAGLASTFIAAAASTAPFLSKLGLMAAAAVGVHQALAQLDPEDKMGSWIDKNIPGAAAIDNFASKFGLGRSYKEQQDAAEGKSSTPAPESSGPAAGQSNEDWLQKKYGGSGGASAANDSIRPGAPPQEIFKSIEDKVGLPAGFLDKMWNTESSRGRNMVSSAGAEGHFQFMPQTAKQYGLENPYDLGQSAQAAGRYMTKLLNEFHGDIRKATASYNWGEDKVEKDIAKWGAAWEQHLPAETSKYIDKILGSSAGQDGRPLGAPSGPALIPSPSATSGASATTPSLTVPGGPIPQTGGDSSTRHEVTINVHGVQDPYAVAQHILEEQRQLSLEAQRNAQSAVR